MTDHGLVLLLGTISSLAGGLAISWATVWVTRTVLGEMKEDWGKLVCLLSGQS